VGEAANSGASNLISSDFETFLRMLTTQVQNQDPLDPMESTEFAVQLATFSSVEQQVLTNDRLEALNNNFSLMGFTQLASWVGMEARAAAPVSYSGQNVSLQAVPAEDAISAQLVVSDVEGTEVTRLDIPETPSNVSWSGALADGSGAPWGTYSFEVLSFDALGKEVSRSTPELYATVTEARLEGGEPVLVLNGGTVVGTDQVTGIRPIGIGP